MSSPPADGAAERPNNDFPYFAKPIEACYAELKCTSSGGTSADDFEKKGLTTEEAAARLAKYGPNKMTEKRKVTLLERIWNQIANVLVFILIVIAIVSLASIAVAPNQQYRVASGIQFGLIVFVITVNTIIGIRMEGSAEKAADALKAMMSADAIVVRNGKEEKIGAEHIVPGDLVKLNLGDRVPADMRMITVSNLSSLEAALTGESVPIDKTVDSIEVKEGMDPMSVPLGDRHNMCFSATLISQGAGMGVVVSTGDYTEIGTINALVSQVETKKTNVLLQIDNIAKGLAVFILLSCAVTFIISFVGYDQEPLVAVNTALTAAVAMVPEGLEAIVTMVYSWAVGNMAKKNAIIRALPAVETLGSVTVICSDKTGTLTKNEMTLTAFVTSDKRYRFNVNASERTPTNFVVDNSYLATRADHTKYLKASEIIKKGPSASRKSKRGGGTFPFGITLGFGKTAHGGVEPEEPEPHVAPQGDGAEEDAYKNSNDMPEGEHPESTFLRLALGGGILCSKCALGEAGGRKGEIGNPTELAILRAAYFGDVPVSDVKDSAPLVAEVPFSSEYKFMATVHEPKPENDTDDYMNELVVHVKGAPDKMIKLCKHQAKSGSFRKADLEPCDQQKWIEEIAVLSSHGLRVLALTRGTIQKGEVKKGDQLGPEFVLERGEPWLTMVGLCAIMDPPRPECVQAIKEAHRAGVRVAMITGDHRDTALAIGGMLGLVDKVHSESITGPEMDGMSDDELRVAAQKYNVFARASPQNKIRIVKALQAEGEVAGMTGDGVNDAPALKAADMGVAMGKEGTEVAREASDMILADDNFATIVTAVREGRVVWDDLRKVLLVNTPINNAQGFTVLFSLAFGYPGSCRNAYDGFDDMCFYDGKDQKCCTGGSVLMPVQVLYCTLGFVCAIEPAEDGIMDIPPRRVGKRLIGRFLFLRIAWGTFLLTITSVGASFWALRINDDPEFETTYNSAQVRALALNVLSFGACAITMSARFSRKSAFHARSFRGNPLAWYSYAIMAVLQVVITYTPGLNEVVFWQDGIDGIMWGMVGLFFVVVLVGMELEKAIRNVLASYKYDVDDMEDGYVVDGGKKVDATSSSAVPLPDEVKRFGRNELSK
eukprot:scaffold8828_cov204-Amphora_coffeaeformis.AAC.2